MNFLCFFSGLLSYLSFILFRKSIFIQKEDNCLIIAAVIFVSGLGFSSTGGITFTVGGADITLTGLAIAALCGVILNAVLPGNDYVFGVSVEGDKSADLGSY